MVQIYSLSTGWLYAFSSSGDSQANAHYTVFVSGPRQPAINGQAVLAQTCLSYLASVSGEGAGTLIYSFLPPFGGEVVFTDFKNNSMWIDECISVTFSLNATGAEAYALATIVVFG